MQRSDSAMSIRLAEEIFRTQYGNTEIARILGCCKATIGRWLATGDMPNAYYLAKLHHLGCDIIYILTGERTRHDYSRSKDNH